MKKTLLLSAALMLMGGTAYADCPEGQAEVTVSITTDRYGAETTWSLTGPAGSPVYASGGPYNNMSTSGAYPQTPVTVCIPDGSLVIFTINDAYGDGLCCSYGQGTYSVTMNGTVAVAYANFATTRQVVFLAGAPVSKDLAMQATTIPEMIGAGNLDIKGTVRNFGSSAVSSFNVGYSIDGGTAVTGTITANVNVNGQYNFTHPTPWDATPGIHTVKLWVEQADGTPDGYPVNDTLTTSVSIATQSVQRTSLLEEFTSSTCGPCYQLNVLNGFDAMLSNLQANQAGSNLAAVKYQMNWPSPGNDPSYNPDGSTRRTYYGVNGVPDVILEGKEMGSTSQSLFTAAMAKPAFATMDVSYILNGTNVEVTVNVTPHFSGSGYKTYIAITEDFYNYPGAYTPQKDYHFAMRKMLPNGGGINMANMVADETQTFTRSYTLNEGGPAQGNYNLWGTVDGITIVAFIQKTSTKEIIQAAFVNDPVGGTGIQDHKANDLLQIWPNPTSDLVYLRYGKATATDVTVEVFNALGERVMATTRNFGAGQVQSINLAGMQPGMYLVRMVADGTVSTQRVNLTH